MKEKYTLLRKTYNILSSGDFPKYNCMFRIDTIKVVSLMQHMQEYIQLKSIRLRNITIAGQKIKIYLCMDEAARDYGVCLKNIRINYKKTKVPWYLVFS